MQVAKRTLLYFLAFCFLFVAIESIVAQTLVDTIPVGGYPDAVAANSITNKIYVANQSSGNVTVIDGITDSTVTVNAGVDPWSAAVNATTNKVYVTNYCGRDPYCEDPTGTVTVVDGATNGTATVDVGTRPIAVAVNPVTNTIYVVNVTSNNVTVIDGMTLLTKTVMVGSEPEAVAVNPVTNKIYVANYCGNDPICRNGTVTAIDGVTLSTTTIAVGSFPDAVAVNSVTNKIYVANDSGNIGTVTVIDGVTNQTTTVNVGNTPLSLAVNSVTNKIYVANELSDNVTVIDGATNNATMVDVGFFPYQVVVNTVTNKIYVSIVSDGTVTVIDGATNGTTVLKIGSAPRPLAVNQVTDRIYLGNQGDNTVSVIDGTPPTALQYVAVSPCRVVDTRLQGGPIEGGTFRNFDIPSSNCNVPATAAAYSLNATVVPEGPLGYLTIWPAGQQQPLVSTMNSLDGRIKANAVIVPAGSGEAISVYASNTTNVVLDIDGYFAPVSGSTLAFYTLPPCRVADTRKQTGDLGGPYLNGGKQRDFPVLEATACNIPSSAQAYSLNFTAVPLQLGQELGYLTVWPTGQSQPLVSTLNNLTGTIVANAAIVPAGTNGEISVYPDANTNLVIDINGYFAPSGQGGLSLYSPAPCRVLDTRKTTGPFSGQLNPPVDVAISPCGISSLAQAFVLNATVVPQGSLGYLTLWPDGQSQPLVSTTNALDGAITSNMAIVPSSNGSIEAYAAGTTQLVLDSFGYFAP